MKIRKVRSNARRRVIEVSTARRTFVYPFARLEPRATTDDPIAAIHVDRELGSEAITYTLASGREGTVHIEQVLDYNKDPGHLRDRLLYSLTVEAQRRLRKSALSRRELIRRLGTSPAQFYRLLDQTNYRKSVDQLVSLLQALDCDVRLTVRARSA
jgi:Cro/C1-type helix-turn-helix DNA-binding protein